MAALITDLLRSRAARTPDAIALRHDAADSLIYKEWDARSNAVARALASVDVGPGCVVPLAFDSRNALAFAIAYMGVLKAGAAAVFCPIDAQYVNVVSLSDDDLRLQLGLSAGFAGSTTAIVGDAVAARLGQTPGVRVHTCAELIDGQADAPFQIRVGADAVAQYSLTSGTTTGKQRAAPKTHGVLARASQMAAMLSGGIVAATPVDAAAGLGLWGVALQAGACMSTISSFDVPGLQRAAQEAPGRQVLALLGYTGTLLSRHPRLFDLDPANFSTVVVGGSFLPVADRTRLAQAFSPVPVLNVYTTAEAWPSHVLGNFDASAPTAIGYVGAGADVSIRGLSGEEVPVTCPGEIWLRTNPRTVPDHVTSDHERIEISTAQDDGWVRTGDLGFVEADGRLHYLDRIFDSREWATVGADLVWLRLVEAVALQLPDVRDAAVFTKRDLDHGTTVHLIVETAPGAAVSSISAGLAARLRPSYQPSTISIVDRIPRTQNGKVRIRAASVAAGLHNDAVHSGS